MPLRFRVLYRVKWPTSGSIRILQRIIYFTFVYLQYLQSCKILENLESGFQEKSMLGFGSNLGLIWNFVKCSLLPFLFTYFDLSSSKNSENYWADSENKVNKNFLPHFLIWDVFPENGFHHFFLNIMSFQYARFQMASETERKQSHYSISVAAIGILMSDQHSSVCSAKS